MIIDIQGWHLDRVNPDGTKGQLFLTDPQIHTRSYKGKNRHDFMYRRYSLGNLGYAGMFKFFKTHDCTDRNTCICWALGLEHPGIGKEKDARVNLKGMDTNGRSVIGATRFGGGGLGGNRNVLGGDLGAIAEGDEEEFYSDGDDPWQCEPIVEHEGW